jgi:hypothetical protein
MTIQSTLPSETAGKGTGDKALSVVTANVDDGNSVTMDGDIHTAWAEAPDGTNVAAVTGTNGADATVAVNAIADGSAGAGVDVTVYAVVEA